MWEISLTNEWFTTNCRLMSGLIYRLCVKEDKIGRMTDALIVCGKRNCGEVKLFSVIGKKKSPSNCNFYSFGTIHSSI
jgi:hypothetical protein